MNMHDKIIYMIDNRLKMFVDSLKFDKTYYGKVISINTNMCVVQINGVNYNVRIKHGADIAIGNVVIVKSPNADINMMYIDGKLL